MTTINFAKLQQDARGASFEALPVGDYDVEVAKADATTSSNGKPMIKTVMRVVTGPHERRPINNNFVLSMENPTAVAIFFRHMRCFGLTEEFFAGLGTTNGLEPVASALVGRRAKLTLGHRDWQGETRNEVTAVKPYTGAPGPVTPGSGPAPLAGPGPVPSPGGPTPYVAPQAPQPVSVAPQPVPAQPQPQPQQFQPAVASATPATDGAPVMPPPQPPSPPAAPVQPNVVPTSGGETGTPSSPPVASTPATSEPQQPQPQPPAVPDPPF